MQVDILDDLAHLQAKLNAVRVYALELGFDEITRLGKALVNVEIAIEMDMAELERESTCQ